VLPATTESARAGPTADITHPDRPMAAGGAWVDVQLDENFAVVGSKTDTEHSDEGGGG
jgi:hypothetical protein